MKKIQRFQITGMTISGFKSYEEATELTFGSRTVITGGNGRGKSSIADAISFAVTGLPFFGERGIDRLHNENNPNVFVSLRYVDEAGKKHELVRTRQKNRMTILLDSRELRQADLTEMFGERDVFLSIFNPLYFIEELGEGGRNLLERYIPVIPKETILAQLPQLVQDALAPMELLSPEGTLKRLRAEIRELGEREIYLTGQKDLSAARKKEQEQTAAVLQQRRSQLAEELAALEEKRFSGLDTKVMEEQLVELSRRYDELAQDKRSPEQAAARYELEGKLARRRAEQYHSPYTEALTETAARLKNLSERYRQEMQIRKMLLSGSACPLCHQAVTEAALPTAQAELDKNAAALVAAGKEAQEQLAQLQELDQKAHSTFEEYRTEDIQKWEQHLSDIVMQKDGGNAGQADNLRDQIRSLTAELEYGNLSQQEYERLTSCREELRQCEAELAAVQRTGQETPSDFDTQLAEIQQTVMEKKQQITNVALYVGKQTELLLSVLRMNRVEFSLYDVVKSTGECKAVFRFNYNGRRYDRLSLSEKIRAGMEVSELVQRLTGRSYPVFVDNMESVDDLENVRPTGQVIMAKCIRNAPLSVQPLQPIPVQTQQAA